MVTHVRRLVLILLTLIPLLGTNALAQDIGDCLSLKPKRPDLGIPIHEQAGVNSWNGQRFAVDAVVRVNEVHASGWLRVSDGETTGWISDRYVDSVVECGSSRRAFRLRRGSSVAIRRCVPRGDLESRMVQGRQTSADSQNS